MKESNCMKKWYIFVLMTVLCISGCNNNVNKEAGIIVQDEQNVIDVNGTDGNSVSDNAQVDDILMVEDGIKFLMDEYDFLEEYGYTEEYLEGYDVTAFVNELLQDHPDEELAKKRFDNFLELYKIDEEYYFNKKTAFMNSRNYSEQVTKADKIAKIGCRVYVNNEHETFIYILDEGLMYYTSVGMGEYRKATLDEGVIERLSNIIEDYDIDTWDNEFIGPNRNTTGSVGIYLNLELDDGRVICYSGSAESSTDFSNDMLSLESRLTGYRYLISE